jgi:hypothetical protein
MYLNVENGRFLYNCNCSCIPLEYMERKFHREKKTIELIETLVECIEFWSKLCANGNFFYCGISLPYIYFYVQWTQCLNSNSSIPTTFWRPILSINCHCWFQHFFSIVSKCLHKHRLLSMSSFIWCNRYSHLEHHLLHSDVSVSLSYSYCF